MHYFLPESPHGARTRDAVRSERLAQTMGGSLRADRFLNQSLEFRSICKLVPHRFLGLDEALSVNFRGRDDLRSTLDDCCLGLLLLGLPQPHVVRHGILVRLAI